MSVAEEFVNRLIEESATCHANGDSHNASLHYMAAGIISQLFNEGDQLRNYLFLLLLLHNKHVKLDKALIERFKDHDGSVSATVGPDGSVELRAEAIDVHSGNEEAVV